MVEEKQLTLHVPPFAAHALYRDDLLVIATANRKYMFLRGFLHYRLDKPEDMG